MKLSVIVPMLKDGGLVLSRSEGTRRIYQIDPAGVNALRAYLDRVWSQALGAYRYAAETASDDL